MTAVSERLALRPFTEAEFDDVFAFTRTSFHDGGPPEWRDSELSIFEFDRSIGIWDGDRIVGSAGAFTRDMTLPGGAAPVACVTWVSVAADYTRRGLLTRMMRHQLTELHEQQREPVAALWASESAIYGRYGYGIASRHAHLFGNLRELRLSRPIPPADRAIRLGEAADPTLRADAAAAYEKVRGDTVGHLDRRDSWWDYRLYDPEHDRDGATPLRLAVHDGPSGPDGYLAYSVRQEWQSDGPAGTVRVREISAANAEAHAALWSFLFGIDLVRDFTCRIAPADTPLVHMLDHPRRLDISLRDNLWVRVVDVGRALAGRAYAAPVEVVFEVTDDFCPWNAGRWRLSGGPAGAICTATDAPADAALTSTELGAAYLGGTTLDALARAGRVRELRPGAVRAASLAFAEPRAPYCPEVF